MVSAEEWTVETWHQKLSIEQLYSPQNGIST